jgi:hypothetical protein
VDRLCCPNREIPHDWKSARGELRGRLGLAEVWGSDAAWLWVCACHVVGSCSNGGEPWNGNRPNGGLGENTENLLGAYCAERVRPLEDGVRGSNYPSSSLISIFTLRLWLNFALPATLFNVSLTQFLLYRSIRDQP